MSLKMFGIVGSNLCNGYAVKYNEKSLKHFQMASMTDMKNSKVVYG